MSETEFRERIDSITQDLPEEFRWFVEDTVWRMDGVLDFADVLKKTKDLTAELLWCVKAYADKRAIGPT